MRAGKFCLLKNTEIILCLGNVISAKTLLGAFGRNLQAPFKLNTNICLIFTNSELYKIASRNEISR